MGVEQAAGEYSMQGGEEQAGGWVEQAGRSRAGRRADRGE